MEDATKSGLIVAGMGAPSHVMRSDSHWKRHMIGVIAAPLAACASFGCKTAVSPPSSTVSGGQASTNAFPKMYGQSTPENALKTFLLALLYHDAKTLHKVILPISDDDFHYLLIGKIPSSEEMKTATAFLSQPIRRYKAGDTITFPSGKMVRVRDNVDYVSVALLQLQPSKSSPPYPFLLEHKKGLWFVRANAIVLARKTAERMQKEKEDQEADDATK